MNCDTRFKNIRACRIDQPFVDRQPQIQAIAVIGPVHPLNCGVGKRQSACAQPIPEIMRDVANEIILKAGEHGVAPQAGANHEKRRASFGPDRYLTQIGGFGRAFGHCAAGYSRPELPTGKKEWAD
jgi:hypothetical protein